jgi:hypothetical protein
MEKDPKKAARLMILVLPLYVGLFAILFLAPEENVLMLALIYTPFAAIISFIVFRNFIMNVVVREKRPEGSYKTVRTAGSDGDTETRRVSVIMSPYITVGKYKLLLNGSEVAEGEGGDRFRMDLTTGEQRLTLNGGIYNIEYTIPAGADDSEIYIWIDRLAKGTDSMLRADDISDRNRNAEERDAAGYRKFRSIMSMMTFAQPVGFVLVAVVMLWTRGYF